MKTVITYSDYCVPKKGYSVEEFASQLDIQSVNANLSHEEVGAILRYSMGIEKVYVEDRSMEADLFSELLKKYFSISKTSPEEIDFVIYTRGDSVSVGDPWSLTDERCVNVPYFLQTQFKMVNAQIFNVEQECAGTFIAMRIASSFIESGAAKKILVLSRNFFENAEKRLMGGMIVVSDGVGIMEISLGTEGLALVDFAGRTEGAITMVKQLSSLELSAKVVETGCEMINEMLTRNDLTIRDILVMIPQNISKNSWTFYCEKLAYPKERVFLENIKNGGHMGDVDIIRNITSVLSKKLLPSQSYALVYGLGTGTSWNTILMKKL